jgi:uncharacterized membrane protein HdeD (DUF308 family)
MTPIITRHWWALVLRGALAIGFALLAIAFAPATFVLLALFLAAYLVLDGVIAIVAGVRAAERHRRWWPFAVEGVLDLLAGAIIYFDPAVVVFLVAIWAIGTGLLLLVPAFGLTGGAGKWLLILNGAVSILLGLAFLAAPVAGVLFLVWSIAIYAVIFGVGLIALGLRVRTLHNMPRAGAHGF